MEQDLACLTSDSKLRLLRRGACLQTMDATCFGWSASGRSVAVGVGEAASVWSQSGKRMLHLDKAAKQSVSCVLFSVPNYLFVVGEDAVVRVWEAEAGKPAQLVAGLEGHRAAASVTCLAFSRAFALLASCSLAGDILLHNLQQGGGASAVCSGSEDDMGFSKIAFRPREAGTLASVGETGALRIWDTTRCGAGPVLSFAGERGHSGPATDLTFADHNVVATVGLDGLAMVYDLRSKSSVCQLDVGCSLQCADFDCRGAVLAVGRDEGAVDMFDLRHGQLRPSASVPVAAGHAVQSLRFAPAQQSGSQQQQPQRAFAVPAMPPAVLEKFVLAAEATEAVEAEAPETPPLMHKQLAESLFSPMRGEAAPKSPFFAAAFLQPNGGTPSATPKAWESAGSVSAFVVREPEGTPAETPFGRRDQPQSQQQQQQQQQQRDLPPPSPIGERAADVPFPQQQLVQSGVLEQTVSSLKLEMHRQMRALHLDMLRAFHEQQQETKRLESKIEELTAENLRLRMNTNQF